MGLGRVWLVLAGCFGLGLGSAAAAAGELESAPEVVFLGRPLGYWVGQATRAEGPESLSLTCQALAAAVDGDDASAKVAASDALVALGPRAQAAVPALVRQLGHPQPWVRVSAMTALTAVGPSAIPELVTALRAGNAGVQNRVISIFGSMGPAAHAAVPVLEEILQPLTGSSRESLVEVLSQIAPEKYPPRTSGRRDSVEELSIPEVVTESNLSRDWPQFHGPNRDAICRETDLLSPWPEGGPELLWRLDGLGTGYSSVSIVGNRLFTMGDRTAAGEGKSQFVIAFDLPSRQEVWATRVGGPHDDGPRCTPTIDGDSVFALGTDGDLVCLERDSGRLRWKRSLPTDFGGKMMSVWKFSESPLVDGDRVVCSPGARDAALVALDKRTGETIWRCSLPDLGPKGLDGAGYASAVVANIAGVRQYVQLLGRGLVGVDAATGRFLWGYNDIANTTANIPSPIVHGDFVLTTTGYNVGCALLKIAREGDSFRAREVYFLAGKDFQNHHGGVVLASGFVYGGHGSNRGDPTCVELGTGRLVWKSRAPAPGSAAVLYADGHLVFRYDRGDVVLVEASPEECRIRGRFLPPTGDGPAWAHPVIHGGKLYLRHSDLLLCYDLRAT